MSILKQEMVDAWIDFNAPLEGRVRHAYRDVRGLVTTGLGNLIDPIGLALALPWQHPDGTPATPDEIAAEWHRVKALPAALPAWKYAGSSPLVLSDEVIDELVLRQLHANAATLAVFFPELASYPAPVQMAISSIAWACGAGFPPRWPRFSAAVRLRAWASAAEECAINADGNPGVIPRNLRNRELLLQAAAQEAA